MGKNRPDIPRSLREPNPLDTWIGMATSAAKKQEVKIETKSIEFTDSKGNTLKLDGLVVDGRPRPEPRPLTNEEIRNMTIGLGERKTDFDK